MSQLAGLAGLKYLEKLEANPNFYNRCLLGQIRKLKELELLFLNDPDTFQKQLDFTLLTQLFFLSREYSCYVSKTFIEDILKLISARITCQEYWNQLTNSEIYIGKGYCYLQDLVNILLERELLISDQFHQNFLEEFDQLCAKHPQEDCKQVYRMIAFPEYTQEILDIIQSNAEMSPEHLDRWLEPTQYFGCLDPNKMYSNGYNGNVTLFHYLAETNQLDSLKYLVSKESLTGMSDIHWGYDIPFATVCGRGHKEVAEYMLSLEGSHGEIDVYDNECQALFSLIEQGNLEMVRFMIDLCSRDMEYFLDCIPSYNRFINEQAKIYYLFIAALKANQMEVFEYFHHRFPEVAYEDLFECSKAQMQKILEIF